MPSTNRPCDRWWSVSAAWAISAGWRRMDSVTAVAMRARRVFPASQVRNVNASKFSSGLRINRAAGNVAASHTPSGTRYIQWSGAQNESAPATSSPRAMAESAAAGGRPSTCTPPPIRPAMSANATRAPEAPLRRSPLPPPNASALREDLAEELQQGAVEFLGPAHREEVVGALHDHGAAGVRDALGEQVRDGEHLRDVAPADRHQRRGRDVAEADDHRFLGGDLELLVDEQRVPVVPRDRADQIVGGLAQGVHPRRQIELVRPVQLAGLRHFVDLVPDRPHARRPVPVAGETGPRQHQGGHPLRVEHRQQQVQRAAERAPHDRGAVDLQRIHLGVPHPRIDQPGVQQQHGMPPPAGLDPQPPAGPDADEAGELLGGTGGAGHGSAPATTSPRCSTSSGVASSETSSSGSPSYRTTSAALPGSTVPTSGTRSRSAAFDVAAFSALSRVRPHSTNRSISSGAFPWGLNGVPASVPTANRTPSRTARRNESRAHDMTCRPFSSW